MQQDTGSFLRQDLLCLPQISHKRALALAKLELHHVRDLLFYFPRSYEDWTDLAELVDSAAPEFVTLQAELATQPKTTRKGKLAWTTVRLLQRKGGVQAVWFNQPWLAEKLSCGISYVFHGRLQRKQGGLTLLNPQFVPLAEYSSQGLQAVYGLAAGLSQKLLRSSLSLVLDQQPAQFLSEALSADMRRKYNLCSLNYALEKIHRPKSREELSIARRRLAFEEIFLLRVALSLSKAERQQGSKAWALETTARARSCLASLKAALPFQLTQAQIAAINDILPDLRRPQAMNRLLQGDVGSGKTIVAAFVLAYTVCCGAQAALMVPTSILAEQHWHSLSQILEPQGIKLALLTANTKASERRAILQGLKAGTIDVLLGTHAILQADIEFRQLALTITDEQHRFGVKQRSSLGDSNNSPELSPHKLVMSATPIPRTLGMIVYGDLDLSVMNELPQGRQRITTEICRRGELERIYGLIQERLAKGEQAYVVCPLLAESEQLDLESAEQLAAELQRDHFPTARLGLIHGKLKGKVKDELMQRFRAGEIDLLVSTSVIEVGIDNPQANCMLIMNADRFGLAQLHQLRGRIGRGKIAANCWLHSDNNSELSTERLNVIRMHQDGFKIAEEDLRLRGPGDFFGTRQHGLPEFRLLNLYEDSEIVALAGQAVEELFALADKQAAIQRCLVALAERFPDFATGMTL